jgi:hypothetical protein
MTIHFVKQASQWSTHFALSVLLKAINRENQDILAHEDLTAPDLLSLTDIGQSEKKNAYVDVVTSTEVGICFGNTLQGLQIRIVWYMKDMRSMKDSSTHPRYSLQHPGVVSKAGFPRIARFRKLPPTVHFVSS